jgi:hypothetical protein
VVAIVEADGVHCHKRAELQHKQLADCAPIEAVVITSDPCTVDMLTDSRFGGVAFAVKIDEGSREIDFFTASFLVIQVSYCDLECDCGFSIISSN